MSIDASKRSLAKATANELEEYKKWLKMGPNAAKMEYFSKKNSGKWVVLKKWHEYQLEGIRRQLGQSGGSSSKGTAQSTPRDSNLVETAHVTTNRNNSIRLTPLEAIEKARRFDAQVADSIVAASITWIPRNINNSEKARMSRNLGRKGHRIAERCQTRKRDCGCKISTQQTKELKARLNELAEKKKEAGKSPRKIQAPSNRFNTPIPKIQGLLIDITSESSSATPNESMSANLRSAIGGSDNVRTRHSQHSDEQPPHGLSFSHISGSGGTHTTGIWIWELPPVRLGKEFWSKSGEVDTPSFDFDLDLFSEMLEQESIPLPTGAELAAHAFLRTVLGK